MRRWCSCVSTSALIAVSAGAAYGQTSVPLDRLTALESGTVVSVVTDWIGAFDGLSTDPTRWSQGVGLGLSGSSSWFRVRVRAVGAPYTIQFPTSTSCMSLDVLSTGATIRLPSVALNAVLHVDLAGPLMVPAGAEGSSASIRARTIDLRGPTTLDQRTSFQNSIFPLDPVSLRNSGSITLRAPAPTSGSSASLTVFGPFTNDGDIEMSGRLPGRSVTVAAASFLNRGRVVLTAGEADGSRQIAAPLHNSGDIIVETKSFMDSGSNPAAGILTNEGNIRVSGEGSLVVRRFERFEHRSGLLDAEGSATIDGVDFLMTDGLLTGEWTVQNADAHFTGGEIDGRIILSECVARIADTTLRGEIEARNSHVEWENGELDGSLILLNSSATVASGGPTHVVLRGLSTIALPDEAIDSLEASSTTLDDEIVPASAAWSGGVIRGVLSVRSAGTNILDVAGSIENMGRIEVRDVSTNRLVVDGTIQNEGEIVIERGWVIGDVVGPGSVRLGLFSLIGAIGGANEFDGLVDVDPHARAQINGETTLRGTLRVQPTVVAFLPNYQHQALFTDSLTIDGATLSIDPGPGFAPAWGNIYNLIGASQVTGDFAAIEAAPLPEPLWRWEIERYGASYRGRIAHIADVNRDLVIDFADINAVVAAWGSAAGGAADVDGDGVVGFGDLAIVVAHFGQYAP